MSLTIIRVSLGFTSISDHALADFAKRIMESIYKVAAYENIPVTAKDLGDAHAAFVEAKALQPKRGVEGTAAKNQQRKEVLLPLLRSLANYVQGACNNDLALLLSSGFDASSTNRTPYALSKPSIIRIVPGKSGEALVTMTTETIARGHEIRVAEVDEYGTPGEFRMLPFSTSSRNILVGGLIPGKLYAYQGRTVGGSTNYSDWSDQIVQRAY